MRQLLLIIFAVLSLGMSGADLQKRITALPFTDGVTAGYNGGTIRLTPATYSPKWTIELKETLRIDSLVDLDGGGIRFVYTGDPAKPAIAFTTRADHGTHRGGVLRNCTVVGGGIGTTANNVVGAKLENVYLNGQGVNLTPPWLAYRCELRNVEVSSPNGTALKINGHNHVISGFAVTGSYQGVTPAAWVELAGQGTWIGGLVEPFGPVTTTAMRITGKWTVIGVWNEGAVGPHIVADGEGAWARLIDVHLVGFYPVIARNAAQIVVNRIRTEGDLPPSYFIGESGGTVTDTPVQTPPAD